jgi:mucosal vascular addressin cell adhesion protein 1
MGLSMFYSENEGELDQVRDNRVTLTIPLRYEVMLTVHG